MDFIISIIIPVYNVENYLDMCIESVLKQSIKNFEIILVNDGSIDNSGMICDHYALKDERVRVIHKSNQGVSAARNDGIKKSTGKWIMFLDSDDWIESSLFEEINSYLNENCDIICFDRVIQNKKIKKLYNSKMKVKYLKKKDFQNLFFKSLYEHAYEAESYKSIKCGSCCGKLYNRNYIYNLKLCFNENLKIAEDVYFFMYILKNAESGIMTNFKGYNYRMNLNSALHKYNENIFYHTMKAYESINDILPNNEKYLEYFQVFIVRRFLYCIRLNYCNMNNKKKYNIRKQEFLNDRYNQLIRNAFLNVDYKYLKNKYLEYILAKLVQYKLFQIINILNKLIDLRDLYYFYRK